MVDSVAFLNGLTRELAQEASLQAIKGIPSQTLIRAMRQERLSASRINLHIPHYWALYLHSGTREVNLPRGRYMAFFPNPANDPRIRGGYPVRRNQVRSLKDLISPDEFRALLRSGQLILIRHRRDTTSEAPRWFDNAGNMRPFIERARQLIPVRFSQFVRDELRDVGVGRPLEL